MLPTLPSITPLITEFEYQQFAQIQESSMVDTFELYEYQTFSNSYGIKNVNLVQVFDNDGNGIFKCGFYHLILTKPNGKNGHGYNFNSLIYRIRLPYNLPSEVLEKIKFGSIVKIKSRKFVNSDFYASELRNTFRVHKEYVSSGHLDFSLLSEQIES